MGRENEKKHIVSREITEGKEKSLSSNVCLKITYKSNIFCRFPYTRLLPCIVDVSLVIRHIAPAAPCRVVKTIASTKITLWVAPDGGVQRQAGESVNNYYCYHTVITPCSHKSCHHWSVISSKPPKMALIRTIRVAYLQIKPEGMFFSISQRGAALETTRREGTHQTRAPEIPTASSNDHRGSREIVQNELSTFSGVDEFII
ncbi:hypothetical protein J6590_005744 [Homalodisca vitripennis]|nr:hypothetical protein J6590_005744 [Homalodisca vitripennis]